MGRRNDIDWELIGRDFRLGELSMNQLVEKHRVNRASIYKKANAEGWTRDLSEQVRVATKAKVNAAIIDKATEKQQSNIKDALSVEVIATKRADVVIEHQAKASKLLLIFERLIDKLNDQLNSTKSIEEIAKMLAENDPSALQALSKALGLSTAFSNLKAAADALEKIVKVERQAHNIDEDEDAKNKNKMPAFEAAVFALAEAKKRKQQQASQESARHG